jgi:hypothetical protein
VKLEMNRDHVAKGQTEEVLMKGANQHASQDASGSINMSKYS